MERVDISNMIYQFASECEKKNDRDLERIKAKGEVVLDMCASGKCT